VYPVGGTCFGIFPLVCANRAALRNPREIGFPATYAREGSRPRDRDEWYSSQREQSLAKRTRPRPRRRRKFATTCGNEPRRGGFGLVSTRERAVDMRFSRRRGREGEEGERRPARISERAQRIRARPHAAAPETLGSTWSPSIAERIVGRREAPVAYTRRYWPNVLTVSTVGSQATAATAVAATMEGMSGRIPWSIRAPGGSAARVATPRVRLTHEARHGRRVNTGTRKAPFRSPPLSLSLSLGSFRTRDSCRAARTHARNTPL